MWNKQLTWLCLSMVNFGKNLANIRKSRQLTQLALANLLDIQPRMIGRWEQGQAKPQFDYIIKLSQILEVSIDHLLLGEEGQSSPIFDIKNKRLKELCKQTDLLKQEDQEVICHFLDMAVRHDKLREIIDKRRL
ncbi:helix-turn-helix transcriptional regulator [Candidatus Regiella endosymbiont of Tuberolachnus salignus]|uniref:helix-turn-helix domain-containing protein n=1 Tax=Candidatus Regiella endosymbiont of Tuberolachnus salignus TaxID=3077956 RepID=UPI0030D3B2A6